jgi:hypothetical protein
MPLFVSKHSPSDLAVRYFEKRRAAWSRGRTGQFVAVAKPGRRYERVYARTFAGALKQAQKHWGETAKVLGVFICGPKPAPVHLSGYGLR